MAQPMPHDGRVGIMGLGYVGLPLATAFAEAGLEVLGIDTSGERVAEVNEGHSTIEDVASVQLAPLVDGGRLRASTDAAGLVDCDAVLICVPTPLGRYREPGLSFVEAATATDRSTLRAVPCRCSNRRPGRARRERCWRRCWPPRAGPSARTSSWPSALSVSTRATGAGASARRRRSWVA